MDNSGCITFVLFNSLFNSLFYFLFYSRNLSKTIIVISWT